LNNLDSIGDHLFISSNDALQNLSGLENLRKVNGSISIHHNQELLNMVGLEGLSSIARNLQVFSNQHLINLHGLDGLKTIGNGIELYENPSLVSLSGIDSVFIDFYPHCQCLDIYSNPVLSFCSIFSICRYLNAPFSWSKIEGNGSGCGSREEVEGACLVSTSRDFDIDTIVINPNPASTELVVSGDKIAEVLILDLFGNLSVLPYQGNIIDISGLYPGMYVLTLKVESKQITMRFIKI